MDCTLGEDFSRLPSGATKEVTEVISRRMRHDGSAVPCQFARQRFGMEGTWGDYDPPMNPNCALSRC